VYENNIFSKMLPRKSDYRNTGNVQQFGFTMVMSEDRRNSVRSPCRRRFQLQHPATGRTFSAQGISISNQGIGLRVKSKDLEDLDIGHGIHLRIDPSEQADSSSPRTLNLRAVIIHVQLDENHPDCKHVGVQFVSTLESSEK